MIGYLRACGQNWIEMWRLNLGCSIFTLFMWHFACGFSWSVSFLAVASPLVLLAFIPEAICRLAHGPNS